MAFPPKACAVAYALGVLDDVAAAASGGAASGGAASLAVEASTSSTVGRALGVELALGITLVALAVCASTDVSRVGFSQATSASSRPTKVTLARLRGKNPRSRFTE